MKKSASIFGGWFVMAAAAVAGSGFAGTWVGKENGLPSVELTIRDKDGGVTGTIGFYFQKRGADGKWQLGEKYTVPLLSPKLEGRVLIFETIHSRKDGSRELGPNNRYRVDFVGSKEARIRILKDQSSGDEPALTLVRRE
jgi:hypothetical protein